MAKMRHVVLALGLLLSSCSATATNIGGESTITQEVGPEGGTIVVRGATVTIPQGALSERKMITIRATENAPPAGYVALSRIYECGPSGTAFAQPVTMKMPFEDDGKGGTMFWSSSADPTFKDLGGQAQGGTMTATVRHFSSGFVGRKN
jgi:hypothetical protein